MKYANTYLLRSLIVSLIFGLFSTHLTIAQHLDIQGHRGCRGLLPENTVPAFLKAVEIGVNTVELDVVISQDKQVVVSHDPFLSHLICLTPEGKTISKQQEKSYNLYQMDYTTISQCDCGSKPHPNFPEQKNFPVSKPLLSEALDSIEQYLKENQLLLVHYNIETKSSPAGDGLFHPAPAEFVDLLVQVLKDKHMLDRTTIQSFDVRTLQYARKKYPEIKLALLVENTKSPSKNINKLGFSPEIYSPYYKLVDQRLLQYAKKQGMKVIPWTVNEPDDIRDMLTKQVDGIISDYPDRVIEIIKEN